jgi:hypothetical protein
MNADDSPTSVTTPSRRRESRRVFAKWFTVIGFLAGGGGVFLCGLRVVFPPPPPGTAFCRGIALAGLFLMLIAAPIAAAVFSFGAWVIGVTLDDLRLDRYRP